MRPRSQTLGTLGRTPARSMAPSAVAPTPPPPERDGLRGWVRSAMFDNVGLKFLSMVLAVTVFLLVNTDKDREITARVGVSYTLPEDRVLVSERIDEVRVTLKGAWRRLRKFDEREIDRINLDLRHVSNGEIAIGSDMIHLPSGLTVTSVNPRSVHVAFDRRMEKVVEVTPAITGRPQHGYVVAEAKPEPTTIKLRGGEGMLAALTAIRTREINLEGRNETFTADSEIAPPEGVEVVGDAQVAVRIRIDEELETRKLPGLTVMLRSDGDTSRWKITPPQVDVTLTGAVVAIEKARSSLVPIVKLTPDLKPREVEVMIEGLPPGIGVKIFPEHVKLAPVKQAAAPSPPRAP